MPIMALDLMSVLDTAMKRAAPAPLPETSPTKTESQACVSRL